MLKQENKMNFKYMKICQPDRGIVTERIVGDGLILTYTEDRREREERPESYPLCTGSFSGNLR